MNDDVVLQITRDNEDGEEGLKLTIKCDGVPELIDICMAIHDALKSNPEFALAFKVATIASMVSDDLKKKDDIQYPDFNKILKEAKINKK